ncbi:hypothetical protein B0T19DRAFT_430451 [Cercophora scortea]|uniref:EamA domain-containing protein n=1 Tax=Cercophora scortea TaxID=314031 RepID=A0AAE0M677_9PEZI|nr:hypothetical protein B0T19DRAFT_430451 [Cercophora scortea]
MSHYLQVPQRSSSKERYDDSSDDENMAPTAHLDGSLRKQKTDSSFDDTTTTLRSLSVSPGPFFRLPAVVPPQQQPRGWRSSWARFWTRNRSVVLVGLSQLFGAVMNMSARLLELEGEGMHPFQILFARMSITTVLSCIYMYRTKVPHFPLGPPGVRGLLVARGVTGFFGIFPMWVSMMYLPLAEATVITFLAPSVTGYLCHLVLKDPFTRKEQIASFIALAGVVLIARPASLFASSSDASIDLPQGNATQSSSVAHLGDDPSPAQRMWAIGIALVGVMGAAAAFGVIRWIGTRAHPLISVNYFSTWCTIVSTAALVGAPLLDIGQPAIRFGLPASPYQWFLLIMLGVAGFIMQFMLTSGLGGEKSNRATAMIYTHMLFAAGFDRWVFGHHMGVVSLVGCGLIIGSALWAALSKKEPEKARPAADMEQTAGAGVEAVPMLGDHEEDEEEGIPLEQVR